MSRKTIGILFAAYFLVALVFAFFIQLMVYERYHLFSAFAGSVIRIAVAFYVMGGLIPMIFWAFCRFRAEKAALPFIAWAFLSVPVTGLSALGNFYERNEEISAATSIANQSGAGYDGFLREFGKSCADTQRSNQLNQKAGITERQIAISCQWLLRQWLRQLPSKKSAFL